MPTWPGSRRPAERTFELRRGSLHPLSRAKLVALPGLEPGRLAGSRFSYHFGFRRPARVRGLDCPFAITADGRIRRRPSSLYTFPIFRAWLGISSKAFPDFGRFYARRFRRGTQLSLKSRASTNSAIGPGFL